MNGLEAWRLDLDAIFDRLAQGLDLFGAYTDWLWALPAFWAATVISLWIYTTWQQRRSDREYLSYASRHLPLLRRIARQRAQEVTFSQRPNRF